MLCECICERKGAIFVAAVSLMAFTAVTTLAVMKERVVMKDI